MKLQRNPSVAPAGRRGMNIFNSLGSNYSSQFVWQALSLANDPQQSQKLTEYLGKRYSGQVILTYKNREALRLGLELLKLPQNSGVAITSFNCYVVYQAVITAGHQPVYVDIDPDTLNFTPHELEKTLKDYPGVKAVVIQNTLGYPCDITVIAAICKKHHLYLIEDLAHSAGSTYSSGEETGTVGDMTALSFSQDKCIDAVSGGALIIRSKVITIDPQFQPISWVKKMQDRLYPVLTISIRALYPYKIGKLWHWILKQLRLLSSPINPEDIVLRKLPSWQAKRAYTCFRELPATIEHRRLIAHVYADNLDSILTSAKITAAIDNATNMRFPIFMNQRESLIRHLKARGIHVGDIWYDTPISPVDLCPQAENVSNKIINLPTHQHVSSKDAEKISQEINQWLTLK